MIRTAWHCSLPATCDSSCHNSSVSSTKRTWTQNDQATERAVRYNDVIVQPGTAFELIISPSGPLLRYDADGDNVFEHIVAPAADVSGALALDKRGPDMSAQAVRLPDGRVQISIAATDSSGVTNTHYSLDSGITHFSYTGPFTVDPAEVTNLQTYADDLAGNRSFILTTITELLAGPVTN